MSVDRRSLVVTWLVAWTGFAVHNTFEFGAGTFRTPDTLGPTAVWVALGAWAVWGGRLGRAALLVWTLLNAVGGALSVLPLPFLPFRPQQTMSHYLVHGVYLATQIPLVVTLVRSLRGSVTA
jgi:hypothetical protein